MDFQDFTKQISHLRKSKNISQETMSKDLHISRATISNFETGKSADIGLKKIMQMFDYLGYEVQIKEKPPFPVFEDFLNA